MTPRMWNRLTEGSRRTLTIAVQKSEEIGNNYVGTEHLLLALLEFDTTAKLILEACGYNVEEIKAKALSVSTDPGK